MVNVDRWLILGTEGRLEAALEASSVSRTVNTSFVESQHRTGRGSNAWKSRQTYRFSKDWLAHEAMIYFTLYRKRAITAHHLGIRFASESCSPQR